MTPKNNKPFSRSKAHINCNTCDMPKFKGGGFASLRNPFRNVEDMNAPSEQIMKGISSLSTVKNPYLNHLKRNRGDIGKFANIMAVLGSISSAALGGKKLFGDDGSATKNSSTLTPVHTSVNSGPDFQNNYAGNPYTTYSGVPFTRDHNAAAVQANNIGKMLYPKPDAHPLGPIYENQYNQQQDDAVRGYNKAFPQGYEHFQTGGEWLKNNVHFDMRDISDMGFTTEGDLSIAAGAGVRPSEKGFNTFKRMGADYNYDHWDVNAELQHDAESGMRYSAGAGYNTDKFGLNLNAIKNIEEGHNISMNLRNKLGRHLNSNISTTPYGEEKTASAVLNYNRPYRGGNLNFNAGANVSNQNAPQFNAGARLSFQTGGEHNSHNDDVKRANAQRVLENAKRRIKERDYVEVPDELKRIAELRRLQGGEGRDAEANNCLGGVCTILKESNVIPEVLWSNTEFTKRAKELGFTANNGWGVKGFNNLQPGDVLIHSQTKNKNGKVYPSHAQIYMGKNEEGEHEFFDNFYGYTRTYTEDKLKELLRVDAKDTSHNATIYKVNPYHDDNPYDLTQEDKLHMQNRDTRKEFEQHKAPKDYNYAISEDAPDYNPVTKKVMDKFTKFANNDGNISNLVKNTGKSRAEIHDSLLNVFGVLGQENYWTTSRGKGLGSNLENLAESALSSLGMAKSLSVGPGQIKYNSIDKELRERYDIKSATDLYDLEKVIPLMTEMDLKNGSVFKNWGNRNELSDKIDGTMDTENPFTAERLPEKNNYMERDSSLNTPSRFNPYLNNQYGSISQKKVLANQNDYIPFNEELIYNLKDAEDFVGPTGNGLEPIMKYNIDKGSYPSKVIDNWQNNLSRKIMTDENGEIPMQELSEVAVRRLRRGGALDRFQIGGNTNPFSEGTGNYMDWRRGDSGAVFDNNGNNIEQREVTPFENFDAVGKQTDSPFQINEDRSFTGNIPLSSNKGVSNTNGMPNNNGAVPQTPGFAEPHIQAPGGAPIPSPGNASGRSSGNASGNRSGGRSLDAVGMQMAAQATAGMNGMTDWLKNRDARKQTEHARINNGNSDVAFNMNYVHDSGYGGYLTNVGVGQNFIPGRAGYVQDRGNTFSYPTSFPAHHQGYAKEGGELERYQKGKPVDNSNPFENPNFFNDRAAMHQDLYLDPNKKRILSKHQVNYGANAKPSFIDKSKEDYTWFDKNPGKLAGPLGIIGPKSRDMINYPFTAARQVLSGQGIPEHMGRGIASGHMKNSSYDTALGLLNPVAWGVNGINGLKEIERGVNLAQQGDKLDNREMYEKGARQAGNGLGETITNAAGLRVGQGAMTTGKLAFRGLLNSFEHGGEVEEGQEYDLSQEEIQELIAQGYDIDILD
jgi:hypothetical protein